MSMETHVIKEIHPGVFYTLLDAPHPAIVLSLLSDNFPWVLWSGHAAGNYEWAKYNLPVSENDRIHEVYSCLVKYDLLAETAKFREIFPSIKKSVNLVQLKVFPPHFVDLNKTNGKRRYELLDKLGWHFDCDIPGARDYAEITSPDRELLEKAIRIREADDD